MGELGARIWDGRESWVQEFGMGSGTQEFGLKREPGAGIWDERAGCRNLGLEIWVQEFGIGELGWLCPLSPLCSCWGTAPAVTTQLVPGPPAHSCSPGCSAWSRLSWKFGNSHAGTKWPQELFVPCCSSCRALSSIFSSF